MKTNLLKAIAYAIVMTTCFNCSVEPVDQTTDPEPITIDFLNYSLADPVLPCDGEDPKSRVTNNSNEVVNFEVRDTDNNLVTFVYGLNPGESSDWKSFPIGLTTFTVNTSVTTKAVSIDMGSCMIYDVAINENNQLDTDDAIQL